MQILVKTRCSAPRRVEVICEAGDPVRLVEAVPFRFGRETYDPLERRKPRLWEAVASLGNRPSVEECASFASAWGFLVRPFDLGGEVPRPGASTQLRASQHHSAWLRPKVLPPFLQAVELFRALSTGRWEPLDLTISSAKSENGYRVAAGVNGQLESAWTSHPRDRGEAVRSLLAEVSEGAMPAVRLRSSREGVYAVADSPLACAWIQLLDEAGTRRGSECEVCGEWILFDARNPRGRRFCSVKCRVAAHRRRHGRD